MLRRNFLGSILAAASAPAIVKTESLMRLAIPKGMEQTPGGVLFWRADGTWAAPVWNTRKFTGETT